MSTTTLIIMYIICNLILGFGSYNVVVKPSENKLLFSLQWLVIILGLIFGALINFIYSGFI